MTLKKKWKVAAISCAIGLCSVGQQVFASDTLFQPPQGEMALISLSRGNCWKNRSSLKRKALIKKLNIERQIEKVQDVKGLKGKISTRESNSY